MMRVVDGSKPLGHLEMREAGSSPLDQAPGFQKGPPPTIMVDRRTARDAT